MSSSAALLSSKDAEFSFDKFHIIVDIMISTKLFCSLVAASLCLQGLSEPTDEPPSMMDADFYKPTEQDMAELHKKFINSLNKPTESPTPPPALPKLLYLANASASHLSQARTLVDEAIKQQGEYNLWRMANPRRGSGPSASRKRTDAGQQPSPPQLTPELITALKLANDTMQKLELKACVLMGYPLGSWKDTCESDLKSAESIIEGDGIDDLIYEVLDKIFAKTEYLHRRFVVYWTGYPQFFAVSDKTCDSSYFIEGIWAGNYLTLPLRLRLNDLSIKLNEKLRYIIRRYNGGRPYPRAKLVDIDALPNIYNGHRFCEPGVKETLKSHEDQNTVAFFYDNGYDDIPDSKEGFNLPAPDDDAPGGWSVNVTSSTCSEAVDPNEPLVAMICSYAKDIANGTIAITEFQGSGGSGPDQAVRNSDGSVTIMDWSTRFEKMFHPKTRANWHIAQAVTDALILN
ncbi:hypothetical protein V2A60_004415 [Cordyceps javanica]|uniref:LysM domain-containing protein n=1 Tax=Cordyceps javanica TaxID=43265 RepID=A0A545VQU6_9HYPO|nr:LysM domain-containing protein [Cordyceps javanica]TQW04099.1 LysM domain-containing protein [Cordyceps javanica]